MASAIHHQDSRAHSDHDVAEVRSLSDLYPVDDAAEAAWEAGAGRRQAVRSAGYACFAAVMAFAFGIGASSPARSEMLAWGTLGAVSAPRAGVAAPSFTSAKQSAIAQNDTTRAPAAAPQEEAPPAPEAPAAAPAPAPKAQVVASISRRAAARGTARAASRYLDDPYADAPSASANKRANYVADPY